MKRILTFVIAIIICGNLFSQTPLRFRKPVSVNGTTWKFTNVTAGVDAIVSITGSKNATIDKIDDSTRYAYAWNPFIKYTNSMINNSDSSYIEFTVSFINSSNGNANILNKLAMTIIDCDGTANFREMIKVSQTATANLNIGSSLNVSSDSKWLTIIGGTTNTSGLDTTLYQYMSQINYSNISTYKMRVGVLGKITSGTVRQASFYFKTFSTMIVALPVNLIAFNASLKRSNADLTWSTASEENMNRFEVCRSTDGFNFSPIGKVEAKTNSNEQVNYEFTDYTVLAENSPVVYYRLKMIDQDGNYILSNISQIRTSALAQTGIISVFPNPTTEYINVNQTEATDITIADAFGKTLKTITDSETNGNSIRFDVRNLQNGIYFINILNMDGSTTSAKFIKR